MQNRDLDQVALVASLQRDTGGNSAEVLDQVVENIREPDGAPAPDHDAHRAGTDGALDRVAAAGRALLRDLRSQPDLHPAALGTRCRVRPCSSWGSIMVIAGSLVIKRIIDIKV